QIAYGIAVMALSFLTFGPLLRTKYPLHPYLDSRSLFFFLYFGVLPGITVLMFWGLVWMWKSRLYAFIAVIGVIVSTYAVVLLLLPRVASAREAAPRTQCKNNLKQIGLALHNYHDRYGTFPPAYIADENGKPMHSWRMLILPFLDAMNVYKKYKFSEPWDSPSNRQLVEFMPALYRCPSHYGSTNGSQKQAETFTTTYHAITGPETMWPGGHGISIGEIKDGSTDTLAVIELDQREMNWMDPNEVSLDELQELYCKPWLEEEYAHTGGTHALHCDGNVRFYSWLTSAEYWRSLWTIADNDALPESAIVSPERASAWKAYQATNWRRDVQKYTAIAFIILALLPLPLVWSTPRRDHWVASNGGTLR
ncbi:MAG: DUF1559 domain-containing protein, partial [Planctomycetota bacterium]|nr:DUF1559 domain-containing protein [Planctomycetota bacterium]